MSRSLSEIVKHEITELAKSFHEQNGSSALRISNKDINLWIIKEITELHGDFNIIKMKIKLLMWFFGATIALMAISQII